MIGLLILLFVGLMLSYVLDRDPEEIFPPFVMTVMIGIYSLALLKKSHHAFFASICVFSLIAVYFVYKLLRYLKNIRYSGTTGLTGMLFKWLRNHIGFLVYLSVCILAIYCYSTHFVHVWDDFHYNATFPKDCYFYGTMPTGVRSATHYKSYLPLQQLFFYWGFQSSGFSEPMMFQYKMVLIYTLLLPFFQRIGRVSGTIMNIIVAVFPIVVPFLFLYEVQESLSMDMVLASLFCYAFINIIYGEKRDWLLYYSISASLVCLTLMKTISVFFTLICLFAWILVILIKRRKGRLGLITAESIWWAVSCLACAGAYLSWTVFCRINGNSTYLSRNLISNMKNGMVIPEYTVDTIRNMLKSLATLHLNLGSRGLTMLAVGVIVFIICLILGLHGLINQGDKVAIFTLILGFIGYFAVLCYTFVFVFEQWEAEELSSLDRYFGTYAAVLCGIFFFRLILAYESDDLILYKISAVVLTIVLFISLPYESLVDVLIPSRYIPTREELYHGRQEAAQEAIPIIDRNLTQGIIMVVNDRGNNIYSRSLDYELIPHVAYEFNVYDYEKQGIAGVFEERLLDVRPDYVYFTLHEQKADDISVYRLTDEYVPVSDIAGLYKRM